MTILNFLPQLFLLTSSSFTVSYHLIVSLNLPAKAHIPLTLVTLFVLSSIYKKLQTHSSKNKDKYPIVITTLLLASMVGCYTAFVNTTDADDIGLFRRVIIQDWASNNTFMRSNQLFRDPSITVMTNIRYITAYEPTVGALSRLTQIDLFLLYHRIAPFLFGFLFVFIYFNLFEQLQLNKKEQFVAMLGLLAFLYIDANEKLAFGRNILPRLWQGKIVVWGLLIPMAITQVIRITGKLEKRSLYLLVLISVSAVGYSSSSLFLMPMLYTSVGLAYYLSSTIKKKTFKESMMIVATAVYPTVLAAMLATGIISQPVLTDNYFSTNAKWLFQLQNITGDSFLRIVAFFGLVVIPPIIHKQRRLGRFLLLFNLSIFLLWFNPLFSQWIIKLTTPAVYWRILYLTTVPLNASLLVVYMYQQLRKNFVPEGDFLPSNSNLSQLISSSNSSNIERIIKLIQRRGLIIGLTIMLLLVISTKKTVPNNISFSLQPRFPEPEYTVAKDLHASIQGKHLLVPEELSWVIALNTPSSTFVTYRKGPTRTAFAYLGRDQEGVRRMQLQYAVEQCSFPADEHIPHTEIVILTGCKDSSQVPQQINTWHQFYNQHGFVAYRLED